MLHTGIARKRIGENTVSLWKFWRGHRVQVTSLVFMCRLRSHAEQRKCIFFVYRNLFGYLVCYSRPLFIIYELVFLLIQKTTIIRIYLLPTVSQNVFYWRLYQSTHRKGFSTRMHRCPARCKQSSAFCGPAIFIWLYFTQMKSYTLSV